MAGLPSGYKIVESGDPEAPWELVGPGGRTVSIDASKKDLREIAVADVGEQSYMKQAQAMQEASGHVQPRRQVRVSARGVESTGTSRALEGMSNLELDQLRRTAKHGTTRAQALNEINRRKETRREASTGLKPNSKVRTKVGAVTKAAGVDPIQPGEVGTVGSIGGGVAQVHFSPQPGRRGSRMAQIPVADLEAADRGTTQSSQSPSSTATPSQDQRKAAERAADASGPTIRPTAADSGKQAADPSIAAASRTKSQDATQKLPSHTTKFAQKNPDLPPGAQRVGRPTNRKLSMDPKQVARRAKRGFPNGH